MKKTLFVLLTLGLFGAAVGGAFLVNGGLEAPPEEVICTQLVEVCNVDGDGWSECTEDIAKWMTKHPEETDGLAACVTDATNCSGVSGCLAGAGLRSLGTGVTDFFKGMGRTLGLGR